MLVARGLEQERFPSGELPGFSLVSSPPPPTHTLFQEENSSFACEANFAFSPRPKTASAKGRPAALQFLIRKGPAPTYLRTQHSIPRFRDSCFLPPSTLCMIRTSSLAFSLLAGAASGRATSKGARVEQTGSRLLSCVPRDLLYVRTTTAVLAARPPVYRIQLLSILLGLKISSFSPPACPSENRPSEGHRVFFSIPKGRFL